MKGARVLVTRAAAQADELARELESRGASPVVVPLLEIGPPSSFAALDAALRSLASYRAVAFTSANAVERFFARFYDVLGTCDVAALPAGIAAFAVGPRTQEALARAGIASAAVPEESRGEALAEPIAHALGDLAGARVLLPRAEEGRDELREALAARGAHVDVVATYRTRLRPDAAEALRAAVAAGLDGATFASPSAVGAFVELLGGTDAARRALREVAVAVIGPTTAARARELGLDDPVIAEVATSAALAEAVARRLAAPP